MSEFQVAPWHAHWRSAQTPRWKCLIYDLVRPLMDRRARVQTPAEALAAFSPDLVLFSRGLPRINRCKLACAGTKLSDATLLVQGTGSGWDVIDWAAQRPARVIATDLFAFEESWEEIARFCWDEFQVPVKFAAAPLEDLAFIEDRTVDLAVSDAVFEHCLDMPAVLAETRRVLKPGGRCWATYGPMWFAPGGDHFSGRGGVEHSLSHIALSAQDYQSYFRAHKAPVEDFQSGGRYVEIDLFSKLTTAEYRRAFIDAGFEIEWFALEMSSQSLHLKAAEPKVWQAALVAIAGTSATPVDLTIKANFVRLVSP